MLILGTEADGFPDTDNRELRYRLPVALQPAVPQDAVPEAMLATHANGGLLILRLLPQWPVLDDDERRVPLAAGRFRILLRAADGTDAGTWHDSAIVAEAVVDRRVTLNSLEASLARRLLRSGGDVLDIEVELAVRGRSPTFPWRIKASSELLRAQIDALLQNQPASWADVETAFQGLRREDFEWYPREPDALPPPADAAFALLAFHAKPLMFTSSADGWTLADDPPEWLDLDLSLARPLSRWFGLRWSFSEFLAAQPDPDRHLFELTTPAPLEAADLLLTHDLTLSDDGIRKIDVEVRGTGPSGELNHSFVPGSPSAARMRFVRETFRDLDLKARIKATVMAPGGPTIVRAELRSNDLSLHITAARLGIRPVLVTAEAAVFDHVAALEIVLGSRNIVLTADAPLRWAIRSSPAVAAATTAVLESGERVALGDVAPTDGNIIVGAATLGVGTMADIVFDWPATQGGAAYLAVSTENGSWRTLQPGAQVYGHVRLKNSLEPVAIRYRTRHVPRDASGATAPMVESDWHQATGPIVTVSL